MSEGDNVDKVLDQVEEAAEEATGLNLDATRELAEQIVRNIELTPGDVSGGVHLGGTRGIREFAFGIAHTLLEAVDAKVEAAMADAAKPKGRAAAK